MYITQRSDETDSHFVERQIQERLLELREECCRMIYQTTAYLNDGNIKRICGGTTNAIANIRDIVERLENLHVQRAKGGATT